MNSTGPLPRPVRLKKNPQDRIESEIATIGTAYPTEIEEPVAMADVAESSGPAVTGTRFLAVADITEASGPKGTEAGGPVMTGTRFQTVPDVAEASGPAGTEAGGPVMTGTRFRTVPDVAEASGPAGAGGPVVTGANYFFWTVTEVAGASGPAGTGAGGPVVAGTRFLAVAEVYAPFEEMKGDLQGDIGRVDQISKIPEEETGSHPFFWTVTEVAGASGPAGTGAGGPVVAGTRFLAVAEVYAPFEEMKGDLQGDIGRVDQISKIPEEETGSHPFFLDSY